eukprot:2618018-Prymnesium_polylepis.1
MYVNIHHIRVHSGRKWESWHTPPLRVVRSQSSGLAFLLPLWDAPAGLSQREVGVITRDVE